MTSSTITGINKMKAGPLPIEWHPGLPIYASEAFLKSLGDDYGWLGGWDAAGELRCILPYTVIRKLGFRLVRFQTGTVPLGAGLDVETEKAFLNDVVQHLRSTGGHTIIPSGNAAIFRTYPGAAAAAPYGTFINHLHQPEETLFREIRKSYRQNIRKAIQAGVEIREGIEHLGTAYRLIADTLKRTEVSFKTWEEFEHRILSLGEYVKIFIAEHQGVAQGCMVSPFSRHTAFDCYAGSKPQPVSGATHLLIWEAMRRFRALGVERFDFQGVRVNPEKGSKQEGILHFKQGFGGEFVQGYLWKYPLQRLTSVAYSAAVRLLQGGDIVDQERYKLVN